MSKSVEQLITALNKQYEIYEELLEIEKNKRKIIIAGKIKELDGITSKEQAMILSIAKIEKIREAIMQNIIKELNINNIENISDLIQYLDISAKTKILSIRDKFTEVLKLVKNENELNSKLIEQSLEYIEFNKNLLTTLENRGSTYGSNANERDVKIKSNLFDAKI